MKILITTVPFGEIDNYPLQLLDSNGIEYLINPFNKKLSEDELVDLIPDFDVIIAGTEPITKTVLNNAKNLKLISRVGIGLDSVDLVEAKRKGITVSYTPDAPAPAVAELTIGLMLSLLRSIHISNQDMHKGEWHRFLGKRLEKSVVGIIGMGRIGSKVTKILSYFPCAGILVNDVRQIDDIEANNLIAWEDKETIYRKSDVISLHVPLTAKTRSMVGRQELELMKPDAMLINTSRGGIVNELDLFEIMQSGHLAGAAIDVFEKEPYNGKLREINNCLLTSHMGSMSQDCRSQMEIEATEEAVRFFKGQPLKNVVPEEEYAIQAFDI